MQFTPNIPKEFLAAYREYDREFTIRKTRVGCVLGIVMVPLFGGLDFYVFIRNRRLIFLLRLLLFGLDGGSFISS
jgi:hypothetical protein